MPTPLLRYFVIAALAFCTSSSFAEDIVPRGPLVAIAGYSQTLHPQDGLRAVTVLSQNHIWYIAAGSRGYTVSVPKAKAQEARVLLAHAIQDEALQVRLYADDDGFVTILKPEDILNPKRNKKSK